MAKSFSVSVNIGGRLLPSLAGAVAGAKTQVRSLETVFATAASRMNAPFLAVQRHIEATNKQLERLRRHGARATMGITAPVGFGAVNMVRKARERNVAENTVRAIGGATEDESRQISADADRLAPLLGPAISYIKATTELLKAGMSVPAARGAVKPIMMGAAISDGLPANELGNAVAKTAVQYRLQMDTVERAGATTQRLVDGLSYAANVTVGSMRDFSESLKFAGGILGATGTSLEQSLAMFTGLAKGGILGSEAGTAVRSLAVRMIKMPKGGQASLAKYGINLSDYVHAKPMTGKGVSDALGATEYSLSEKEANAAIARGGASPEGQKKAIAKALAVKYRAKSATDLAAIQNVVDEVVGIAGSIIDIFAFLKKLKAVGIAPGDLANVAEGRQISRTQTLIDSDLDGNLKDATEKASGYGEKTFGVMNQGLEAMMKRLEAAWSQFGDSLTKSVMPQLLNVFERVADFTKSLATANPALLRLGVGFTAAAAAAGPLMFALGSIGRLATMAIGGTVATVLGLASGIRAVGVAATLGAVRLRAFVAGAVLLGTVGGPMAIASAAATSLAGAIRGLAVASWALVANPVGLSIAAIVAGLAALGTWVYNNASGIAEFFKTFASVFADGVGGANGPLGTMVGYLKDAATWISNLLGPLDESGDRWRSWGASVGIAAAEGVNKIVGAIQSVVGWINTLIEVATKAGSAIAGMFKSSPAAGAGKSPFVSNSISGARALGGPVLSGKTYLVGERGPELFTPGFSGNIHTNDTLRKLTADGAAAVAGSTTNTSSTRTYALNPTINIVGSDDPRAIAGQVRAEMERYLHDLEAEQRGLLSD